MKGLSRMRGNSHVRFLGEGLAVMPSSYPIMGKYYKEDKKTILPLAIQVHHAVCDGFHICRFVNELQELINS